MITPALRSVPRSDSALDPRAGEGPALRERRERAQRED